MNEWYGIGLLTVVSILTGVGHICFKLTAVDNLTFSHKLRSGKFIAGTTCFLAGPVLAIVAGRLVSFSLLYGMTAMNFVFILLFSHAYLHEAIDAKKLAGVALIVCGLIVIALGKS